MELQVVAFLLRHQPYVAAPPELGSSISSFLGPSSNFSLSEACAFSSIKLLDWIWESSCTCITERTSEWSLANFLRSNCHYYRWRFSKAMEVVAREGDLVILEWVFQHFNGCVVSVDAVELSAGNGHIELLKYLLEHDAGRGYQYIRKVIDGEDENGPSQSVPDMAVDWKEPGNCVCWGGRSIIRAITNNHFDVAAWLFEHSPHQHTHNETDLVIYAALDAGAVELSKFLLPADRSILDYAGECSHPNVIEMVLNSGRQYLSPNSAAVAVNNSARVGRQDLLKRIVKLYSSLPAHFWMLSMREAIKRDDLYIFQWLLKYPTGQEAILAVKSANEPLGFVSVAASRGSVGMLQYLFDEDVADKYEDALVQGVRDGHLNAVKWLLPHITKFEIFWALKKQPRRNNWGVRKDLIKESVDDHLYVE